jgi:hypothetical protein
MKPSVIAKALAQGILVAAALLYLLWYFAPKDLIAKRFLLDIMPGPNKDFFRILSDTERFPKFTLAVIEPLDAKRGEIQKLTVAVEDSAGIKGVSAITELDSAAFELPLKLVAGDETSGYWTNAWIMRDTNSKIYRTKFVAINRRGEKNTITFAWSNPCTTPQSGDWIINSNCAIAGMKKINNGNIDIADNYTLTILANGKLIYDSGKQISIGKGQIAINNFAQIIETNSPLP